VKSKAESTLIIFVTSTGYSQGIRLACRRVNSAYHLTLYCDCVNILEDFAPNSGDKRTGCCITTTHRLTFPFHLGIFHHKQHDSRPPTTLLAWLGPLRLFCFPDSRYSHFDTTAVNGGRIAGGANTLTEKEFQDAFKIGRSAGNGEEARKGPTWRVKLASRSKVSFWPGGSTNPWNYG
jgi:hypothetical protein